jgi:rfaE bifunctional protein kinase chain/domain
MTITSNVTSRFKGKHIVIVGDVVADQFVSGTITRVSREAPVFIMRHDETETRPGGAANAAANVASLGGKVSLIGLMGTDPDSELLAAELERSGVSSASIVRNVSIRTTTKVRVLAGQQYAPRHQVIRIDHENSAMISDELRSSISEKFAAAASTADAIVVSDYNYGVTDQGIFEQVRDLARERGIPLLIDSRFRLSSFPDASSATPNQEEVEQMLGGPMTNEGCEKLRSDLGLTALLVTCGGKGMRLYESNAASVEIPAVGSADAVDVTGAGDTVIAAYALGLAAGMSYTDAAMVANHAGGIVVMKKGTATASSAELEASIAAHSAGIAKGL